MGRTRFPNPFFATVPLPFLTNLDQWDGYAAQRARLLGTIAARGVANPVVLSAATSTPRGSTTSSSTPTTRTPRSSRPSSSRTSISSDFPAAFDAPIKAACCPRDNPCTQVLRRLAARLPAHGRRPRPLARPGPDGATPSPSQDGDRRTTAAAFAVAAG